MEGNGLDLSKIIKMVTENPAMLQTAMSFAGKLKENMGSNAPPEPPTPPQPAEPLSLPIPKEKNNAREDERKLLLALRPYLSQTRQDKIDFVLKILQLLELASNLGLNFDSKEKGSGHDV